MVGNLDIWTALLKYYWVDYWEYSWAILLFVRYPPRVVGGLWCDGVGCDMCYYDCDSGGEPAGQIARALSPNNTNWVISPEGTARYSAFILSSARVLIGVGVRNARKKPKNPSYIQQAPLELVFRERAQGSSSTRSALQ